LTFVPAWVYLQTSESATPWKQAEFLSICLIIRE
jgi:hypothetical protein